jgi:hypothetical protein
VDRPDPGGVVRRGEAEQTDCFVDWSGAAGFGCDRKATMRVYGLPLCEVHGEEAAGGALGVEPSELVKAS